MLDLLSVLGGVITVCLIVLGVFIWMMRELIKEEKGK